MFIITPIIIIIFCIINIIFINRENKKKIFYTSLNWILMVFIIFLINLIIFDNFKSFQNQFILNWFNFNFLDLSWGKLLISVDGVSIFFIGLSIILIPICLLISYKTIKFLFKEFVIFLNFTLIFLIIVFSIFDILGFYILFESILIPVFIIIGVWGSRIEKIKAAFYFFFYTLIGSLLMLISLFKLYSITGTTNYENLVIINLPYKLQIWLFLGFFFSLSVKIPMIPFHIWLPQAHVEAPIAGSILLAGILLKLGGYGFIRFSYPLFPVASEYFTPFILILSSIAIIYGALSTCRQIDIKRLIAYSSVSHMGLVTLSIFCHSIEGLISSILVMLAHGIISSGLFMSSSVIYWRLHSRIIKYFRGLVIIMPIFSIITFILILGNIGFPLTLNFIAEFFSIITAFKYSLVLSIITCIGAFISIVYSLYLYNRVFFGELSPHLKFPRDLISIEFYSFLPLIILTIIFGIKPDLILNLINFTSYINISY